ERGRFFRGSEQGRRSRRTTHRAVARPAGRGRGECAGALCRSPARAGNTVHCDDCVESKYHCGRPVGASAATVVAHRRAASARRRSGVDAIAFALRPRAYRNRLVGWRRHRPRLFRRPRHAWRGALVVPRSRRSVVRARDLRLMPYAELHCISNFTFLRGASHPEELVARAHKLGYAALAITDECSLAGIVRAHVEAKKRELPLIVGSEFRLEDGTRFLLLATDRESYGRLAALITTGRRNAAKGS